MVAGGRVRDAAVEALCTHRERGDRAVQHLRPSRARIARHLARGRDEPLNEARFPWRGANWDRGIQATSASSRAPCPGPMSPLALSIGCLLAARHGALIIRSEFAAPW